MNTPRIVFAGTPAFALASLTALIEAGCNVVAVYTQPDRPAGRGRKLTASPVKVFAEANDIEVRQPVSFRDEEVAEGLAELNADVMIVAAYGLLLPQHVLDIPAAGCLNVHASLLPRWRGAAPIQAAIMANDSSTGVSLMQMTLGLDEGPVYSERRVSIGGSESAAELHDRLATLGGELLVADLDRILAGELIAQEQDSQLSTYAPKIKTVDAELDWNSSSDHLQRQVRAYNPAPGAYFFYDHDGERLRIKVWNATADHAASGVAGTVIDHDSDSIVIAAAEGGLRITELQLPGKRRGPASDLVAKLGLS